MLNEKGYHRPSFEEILETKIQKARELFGEDINVSEQTPLGKFIRIGAYDLAQAYEDAEAIYYARFPNTASGASLDRLCVFAGISRKPATRALHTIKVYSSTELASETTIGIGELIVCGDDSIMFYNVNNFVLPPFGACADVEVECLTAGTIGNVVAISNIVNPLADVSHVESGGMRVTGEETESDFDLRKRFSAVIEGIGSGNINAIKANLLKVNGVHDANITVDYDNHTFTCYIYGDFDNQEVAKAIFNTAPIGIKSNGNITEIVNDSGGYPHEVSFSKMHDVAIDVTVNFRTNSKFPINGNELIKKNISDYINGLDAGGTVVYTALFGKVYSVEGVEEVTDILLHNSAENVELNMSQVAVLGMIKLNNASVPSNDEVADLM